MAFRRDDRCGARNRPLYAPSEPEPPIDATTQVRLTSLGEAFLQLLREDPTLSRLLEDPEEGAEPGDA